MNFLLTLILVLASLGVIIGITVALAHYCYHVGRSRIKSFPCGRGKFEYFKREFNKIDNWDFPTWVDSLFSYDYNRKSISGCCYGYKRAYLHCGDIIFNEKFMLLGPIDYFKAQYLIYKKVKEIRSSKRRVVDWSKED